MTITQAEAIRGAVIQAFDSLTNEQVKQLATEPFVELRTALLLPAAA